MPPSTGCAPGTPATPTTPPSFILIVPLFHVTGSIPVMLGCFASGLKLVIMYKWDPERALELIERERVTNFVGVPTQSWDMLQSPRFAEFDTSSLDRRRRRRRARRRPSWCAGWRPASPRPARTSATA